MPIEMKIVDNPNPKEFLKMQCALGHTWGDGKNVYFNETCPECGGGVSGMFERRIMKVDSDEFKNMFGSKGTI